MSVSADRSRTGYVALVFWALLGVVAVMSVSAATASAETFEGAEAAAERPTNEVTEVAASPATVTTEATAAKGVETAPPPAPTTTTETVQHQEAQAPVSPPPAITTAGSEKASTVRGEAVSAPKGTGPAPTAGHQSDAGSESVATSPAASPVSPTYEAGASGTEAVIEAGEAPVEHSRAVGRAPEETSSGAPDESSTRGQVATQPVTDVHAVSSSLAAATTDTSSIGSLPAKIPAAIESAFLVPEMPMYALMVISVLGVLTFMVWDGGGFQRVRRRRR